jgi:uncharacterized membrane protein
MRRLIFTSLMVSAAVALAGALLSVATAANTPSTPAGGPVLLLATANGSPKGTIVLAGAIGDYGKTLTIDKNGKPNANGNFVEITLKKGSFEVNSTAFNKKTAKAPPTINDKATCSFAFTASGPVTLFNGTGLYKGISGTVNITVNFVGVGPRFTSGKKTGQCNTSNSAKPLASSGTISGRGTVKFS